MSKDSIVNMLKTLYKYNSVEIQHTFSQNDQPFLLVRCITNTSIIEITNLKSQTIELYDNLEASVAVIQSLIKIEAKS